MAYRFTFLFFIFSCFVACAQPVNLVPNPGFEERSECQWNNGHIHHAPPWFRPTKGTPDVFHVCGAVNPDPCPYPEIVSLNQWHFGVPTNFLGCQEPYEGDGYGGFFAMAPGYAPDVEWREYLSVELVEPLIENEIYEVSFYVSLAERMARGIWAIQVSFINELDTNYLSANHLPITPSLSNSAGNFIVDKENWTLLNWTYIARGGERFMYIGNFQSNSEIESTNALPEGQDSFNHYLNHAYYYVDNVYVGSNSLNLSRRSENQLKVWPNPTTGILNVQAPTFTSYRIMDILGTELIQGITGNQEYVQISVDLLKDGLYMLVLEDKSRSWQSCQKFVKR